MSGLRLSRDPACHECGRLGQTLHEVRVYDGGNHGRTRRLCLSCLERFAGHELPSFRLAASTASLLVLALTL